MSTTVFPEMNGFVDAARELGRQEEREDIMQYALILADWAVKQHDVCSASALRAFADEVREGEHRKMLKALRIEQRGEHLKPDDEGHRS
jgi:ferritin-like metal-binding protein YciE